MQPRNGGSTALKDLYYSLYTNSGIPRSERLSAEFTRVLFTARYLFHTLEISPETIDEMSNTELTKLVKKQFNIIKKKNSIFSNKEEIAISGESLREAVALVFQELAKNVDKDEDLLINSFQTFIGYTARGEKGQFFTPVSAVDMMVRIINPKSGESVVDPACGVGTFLTKSISHSNGGIDVTGIDLDIDTIKVFEASIEWFGIERATSFQLDSLDINNYPKGLKEIFDKGTDIILTNPPFGSNIPVKSPKILSQFSFGKVWDKNSRGTWEPTDKMRKKQDPQVLFVELCVKFLKANGRMGIVLPEAILGGSSNGYVLDFLRAHGAITGIVDCPRTLFQPSTDTKTVILFFEKGKKTASIRMANPQTCGHNKRGDLLLGNDGEIDNQMAEIPRVWGKKSASSLCYSLSKGQYDPYYLIPRFYMSETLKNLQGLKDVELKSIGEYIDEGVLTVSSGIEPGSSSYIESGYRFIRTSDLENFEISRNPTKRVGDAVLEKFKKKWQLNRGDILLVVDGRYRIGNFAFVSKFDLDVVIQSHLKIIRSSNDKKLAPELLCYLLLHPLVKKQFQDFTLIHSTLATVGSRYKQIKLPMPKSSTEKERIIAEMRDALERRAESLQMFSELSNSTN